MPVGCHKVTPSWLIAQKRYGTTPYQTLTKCTNSRRLFIWLSFYIVFGETAKSIYGDVFSTRYLDNDKTFNSTFFNWFYMHKLVILNHSRVSLVTKKSIALFGVSSNLLRRIVGKGRMMIMQLRI